MSESFDVLDANMKDLYDPGDQADRIKVPLRRDPPPAPDEPGALSPHPECSPNADVELVLLSGMNLALLQGTAVEAVCRSLGKEKSVGKVKHVWGPPAGLWPNTALMRVNISKDNPNMTCQAVPLQSQSMVSHQQDNDPPSRPDATRVLSHRPSPATRTHHEPQSGVLNSFLM
ncbi:unnamed protein product [Pleuronectes platessa]|uniref:Uncharacterized protein n=1 Tax=Pleuronectes platessa TaxID=8262 RepID=A0A9N7YMW9_PLEPL|nr:unnamed protein product [Pleuronectes platessa]